jgi:hypothetical protein
MGSGEASRRAAARTRPLLRASRLRQLLLAKTGNLKAVMSAMGHGDVRTAMVYQHPEGEIIRNALNARHIPRPTVQDDNRQVLEPNFDWFPKSISSLLMPDQ